MTLKGFLWQQLLCLPKTKTMWCYSVWTQKDLLSSKKLTMIWEISLWNIQATWIPSISINASISQQQMTKVKTIPCAFNSIAADQLQEPRLRPLRCSKLAREVTHGIWKVQQPDWIWFLLSVRQPMHWALTPSSAKILAIQICNFLQRPSHENNRSTRKQCKVDYQKVCLGAEGVMLEDKEHLYCLNHGEALKLHAYTLTDSICEKLNLDSYNFENSILNSE